MPAEPRQPRTADEELLAAEQASVGERGDDAERVARMREELERGFEALRELGPAVSLFGSARTPAGDPRYALALQTGAALAEAGFAVITGGGGGVMEAANRGALEAGGRSVGLAIDLPFERHLNRFIDLPLRFHYFFVRKVMFVRYASAFVVLPGGLGTMDELFEALTLIQTRKIRDFPVVLVGGDYWQGLLDWLRETMLAAGNIWAEDLDRLHVVERPAEVCDIVSAAAERQGATRAGH